MNKEKKEEPKGENIDWEKAEAEEPEVQQDVVEDSSLAKVDIVTRGEKATLSTPVKEFEDLKNSFQSMLIALTKFIEAAGLETGKDETSVQVNMLRLEFEELRKDIQAAYKMSEDLVPRSDFEKYKTDADEREAKAREDYVTRKEFERFREAVREVI
jgi:hypothetical protein